MWLLALPNGPSRCTTSAQLIESSSAKCPDSVAVQRWLEREVVSGKHLDDRGGGFPAAVSGSYRSERLKKRECPISRVADEMKQLRRLHAMAFRGIQITPEEALV